jgi:S-formylglutathione hydrolase FrmB
MVGGELDKGGNFKSRPLLSRGMPKLILAAWLGIALGCLCSCQKRQETLAQVVVPPSTVLRDRTFHSKALNADVTYRIIQPSSFRLGQTIRVVYLLHGNGGGFRDWSTNSSIAQMARNGYVLVMPEGRSSYFMNSASKPDERYEDFITHDLTVDAEQGLPSLITRSDRALIGVSMGGFAAIVLASNTLNSMDLSAR